MLFFALPSYCLKVSINCTCSNVITHICTKTQKFAINILHNYDSNYAWQPCLDTTPQRERDVNLFITVLNVRYTSIK